MRARIEAVRSRTCSLAIRPERQAVASQCRLRKDSCHWYRQVVVKADGNHPVLGLDVPWASFFSGEPVSA